MKKLIITAAIACVFSIVPTALKAQKVTPYQLLQIYKIYNTDNSERLRNTYDYVILMDSRWKMLPDGEYNNGLKHKTWLFDKEPIDNFLHRLTVASQDENATGTKSNMVNYDFVESELWKQYNDQMILMKAELINERDEKGGHKKTYHINGISIVLTAYPPGMLSEKAMFTVFISD